MTADAGWLFDIVARSEEHTSELQSRRDLVCGLLLEKKTTADMRDGDYDGSPSNRASRMMGDTHGGHIVCWQAMADLAGDSLVDGVFFLFMGAQPSELYTLSLHDALPI